jgi:hypothetical protein
VLTEKTAKAMDAWMLVHPNRSKKLFPRVRTRCHCERAIGGPLQKVWDQLAGPVLEERELMALESIRRLLRKVKFNARRLILLRVSEDRGWDPDFLMQLAEEWPTEWATRGEMTRQEMRTAQDQLDRDWEDDPDNLHRRMGEHE